MSKSTKSTKSNHKLANELTCNELLLQPWFLPARTEQAIRQLVPDNYKRKMRYLFDDYGCMICGDYKEAYAGNGMCKYCQGTVVRRLQASAHRRMKSQPKQRIEVDMLRHVTIAKKLLGKFSPGYRLASERRRANVPRIVNPVLGALRAYSLKKGEPTSPSG
jgi:hypothetical protein